MVFSSSPGCPNSFVSLSSLASLHLSPCLAGGVRLFGCLSSLVSLHLFPCLAGGVRLFGCLSSLVSLHIPAGLAGGARLFGCVFTLHLSPSICRPGWWCPALWVSVFTCLPFVSRSGWWCPPLWVCLSPSLAGGVGLCDACLRLSGCDWLCGCLPVHVSPSLAGGVRLFGCLLSLLPPSFVFQSGSVFTCLPSCASLSCVSQSGWRCLVSWMSVFTCLPPFVSHWLAWLSMAGGAQSPDCTLPLSPFMCLPLSASLAGGVLACVRLFVSLPGWQCPAL